MKKYAAFFSFILITMNGFAQQNKDSARVIIHSSNDTAISRTPEKKAETWIQEMPVYPGGDQALLTYIKKNIDYKNIEGKMEGTVYVRFIIDSTGVVKNVKVIEGKGLGHGCDEEAIRVISSLPQWSPGKQNGKPVPVWYTVPVRFKKKK